ncbi:MAG: hypothetical protein OHK0013_32140 [Sandaracinaceae bacterium]
MIHGLRTPSFPGRLPNKHALGIDVGNAKVKLCLIELGSGSVRWTSTMLPYDARRPRARHRDFEQGLPAALRETMGGLDVVTAVAVMTNGYAYPTFAEGAAHTAGVLASALPETDVRVLAIDGSTVAAADVPRRAAEVVFTNGLGAVHLVRRADLEGRPPSAMVVDTGGDTSQVWALVRGEVDPAVRADPDGPLLHRLVHGKFVWIGSQSTPLEALAQDVETGGRRLPVIPRGVTFDHVASLLGLIPALHAERLSLFGLHPSREQALSALAESVNLDRSLARDEELLALARRFADLAVARLAQSLAKARSTLPAEAASRLVVFGIGQELARRAALEVGFPTAAIWLGGELVGSEQAIVASVYGAAHHAAELALGQPLPPCWQPGTDA